MQDLLKESKLSVWRMPVSPNLAKVLGLIVSIAACQLVGAVGAIATSSSVRTWYQTLVKPSFNPPGWVFAPVWTALYTLMGIAAWLVWKKGWAVPAVRTALMAFVVQLVLNALWSWAFFGFRQPFWGLVDLFALWAAIAVTLVLFLRISVAAGVLMTPYLLWVSFAGVLNYYIWRLNP